MRDYLYILIIAAAVTYLLTPLVRRFAFLIKAYREPRERDVHKEPTPLIGGLAMFGGMAAALFIAERLSYLKSAFPSSRTVPGLLAAGLLLVVIGIVDDRFELSALSKAAGQVAAGGILAWSGTYLPWLPLPNGGEFVLEPDLSYTLTILLVVVTINAVNFIDGMDGLAAGVVGIAGLSFFIYSYTLAASLSLPSQSVPAVAAVVLVGMCAGFLPHNFNPARIFMGDTGAMLIGLLLAYLPISSTLSLDPSVLVNYSSGHAVNRFPTILPILLPVAILIIPYTDLLLAVVRRTARGKSPFSPDREHLHHRLQNMGHSHRQSVLLMYLWAALFSGAVVGLSVVKTQLVWLGVVTLAALIALLVATIPQWRPWRRRPVTAVPGGTAVAVSGASAGAAGASAGAAGGSAGAARDGADVGRAGAARPQPTIAPSFTPHNDPSFPSYPPAARGGYGPAGFEAANGVAGPNGVAGANGVAPGTDGVQEANGDGALREPGRPAQGWTFRDYPVPPKSSRR